MPRQHSDGWMRSEKGSILILTAATCLIFTLLFMGITEYGRWLLVKEQAQTAADAASLAGAVSGISSIVTLQITGYQVRSRTVILVDEETGEEYTTVYYETVYKNFTETGYERPLIELEGWKKICNAKGYAPSSYKIIDRHVEYNESIAKQAANMLLAENTPQGSSKINNVTVHGNRNDPYYPSVVVHVITKIGTMFPDSDILPGEYSIKTVSQGDTFFKDPKTGKWSKAPPDATMEGLH
jgi:hypothetical protein